MTTPGMYSSVTTGSPLQKPSLSRERIIKFNGWKIVFLSSSMRQADFSFFNCLIKWQYPECRAKAYL